MQHATPGQRTLRMSNIFLTIHFHFRFCRRLGDGHNCRCGVVKLNDLRVSYHLYSYTQYTADL